MARPLKEALTEAPVKDWFNDIKSVLSSKPKTSFAKSTPTPPQAPPQKQPKLPGLTSPGKSDPAVQQAQPKQAAPSDKPVEPKKKWISAGGVVLQAPDDLTKVLVIKPANNYGPWAFPKGQIDPGETMIQAATREVYEETGVRAKLLPMGRGSYLGKAEGSMSFTHFFLMYKAGGTPRPSDETEKAIFVTWDEAMQLFASAHNKRDQKVALKAMKVLGLLGDTEQSK